MLRSLFVCLLLQIFQDAPSEMDGESGSPATNHLFNINRNATKLDQKHAEISQYLVALMLFLCKRVRLVSPRSNFKTCLFALSMSLRSQLLTVRSCLTGNHAQLEWSTWDKARNTHCQFPCVSIQTSNSPATLLWPGGTYFFVTSFARESTQWLTRENGRPQECIRSAIAIMSWDSTWGSTASVSFCW